MEACNDTPHGKLTEEVGELKEAIKHLEEKHVESNEALKDLQANKVKDSFKDTVESTRIEPFLGENRVILDYLNRENT